MKQICIYRYDGEKYWLEYNEKKYHLDNGSKFFNGDIIEYDTIDKSLTIVSSTIQDKYIPGVLVYNGKMYGKYKNKPLYKCIPNDQRISPFIIPYEPKHIGFNKKKINKYVIIRFKYWNAKYPQGEIHQMIGDVTEDINIYEYLIWCNQLQDAIYNKDLKQKANKMVRQRSIPEWIEYMKETYNIQDRRNNNTYQDGYTYNIISIDPYGCKDIDDAISLLENENEIILSIYISNVVLWLDVLDLWKEISSQISSIYFPNEYKKSMFPPILSESVCSLNTSESKVAFVMDIIIHKHTMEISNITYHNAIIDVRENYDYENVIDDPYYKKIYHVVKLLNESYPLIQRVNNSHDMIEYVMIFMNYYVAKEMKQMKKGIFRVMHDNDDNHDSDNTIHSENVDIPEELRSFVHIHNHPGSEYSITPKEHSYMQLNCYLHITSPIRRIVDVYNMLLYMQEKNMIKKREIHPKLETFDLKYMDEFNYKMKCIRKIQNESLLIHKVNERLYDTIYDGYVIDIVYDGYCNVYIPKLNVCKYMHYSGNELKLYNKYQFKLYLFKDEARLRKKIVLELCIT